jgi:rhodanese-related sulfurtransferase
MIGEIEPLELRDRQQAGELWPILDVRETWEIETANISGTLHMPMAEVPQRSGELDPGQAIAVLCHSGARSRHVAEFLVTRGFTRVANVSGGIDRWSRTADPSIPRY